MISKERLDKCRSERIINALGGKTILAKKFGVSRQAVDQWAKTGIPAYRVQTLRLMFPNTKEIRDTDDFQPWLS